MSRRLPCLHVFGGANPAAGLRQGAPSYGVLCLSIDENFGSVVCV